MTREWFNKYLEVVVERAFKEGVLWTMHQVIPMEEAIKRAEDRILDEKY